MYAVGQSYARMLFMTSITSSPSEGVVDGVHSNARRLYTSRPKPPGEEEEEDERDDDDEQVDYCPKGSHHRIAATCDHDLPEEEVESLVQDEGRQVSVSQRLCM